MFVATHFMIVNNYHLTLDFTILGRIGKTVTTVFDLQGGRGVPLTLLKNFFDCYWGRGGTPPNLLEKNYFRISPRSKTIVVFQSFPKFGLSGRQTAGSLTI